MTNSPSQTDAQIQCLAMAYEKLTGLQLSHRGVFDHRTQSWYLFIQAGWSVQDLETVVLYLKRQIRENGWHPCVLRFSYLIERLDRFEEWLAEARAVEHNQRPAPTNKERALAQFRATMPDPDVAAPARPVASLIPKLIADMREAIERKEA